MVDKMNIGVIGGGVIGCAIAYELSKRLKDIYLFEKNPYIGDEQSGRNSGVIHSGIYYKNDSLIAKFCLEGNEMLYPFCKQHNIPYRNTAKVVIATNKEEDKALEDLLKNAKQNGVPDLRLIYGEELKRLEPNVIGTSALYCPTTGIVDPAELVKTLVTLAEQNGVMVLKNTKIMNIKPENKHFKIKSTRGEIDVEHLVNATGLYSTEIAARINPKYSKYETTLRRGEFYYFLPKRKELLVNTNIYPAPTPECTVNIHLTPTFDDGKIRVGPAWKPIQDPNNFENERHPLEDFYEYIKVFFPSIKKEDLKIDYTGVTLNIKKDGKKFDEFVIEKDEDYSNCVHLIGIKSPGLTSSLAIAKYVNQLTKDWES